MVSARVLYDVSQLGLLWYLPPGQSYGLARMTSQLVPRLLGSGGDGEIAATALDHAIECSRLMARDFPDQLPALLNPRSSRCDLAATDYLGRRYHGEQHPALWPRTVRKLLGAYQRRRMRYDNVLGSAVSEARLLHREILIDFDAAEFPGLRTLVTVHDLIPIQYPQWGEGGDALGARLRAAGAQGADFLCISEEVRHGLIDFLKISEQRTHLVHQAADAEHFYPAHDPAGLDRVMKRYNLPDSGRYFIGLSSFAPRKNIETMIRAFALMTVDRAADDDLHLVLAGHVTEAERARAEALAEECGIGGQVRVVGAFSDHDIAPMISQSLGFVFLSLAEGFGLPPLEAMMCGSAVICSDATSLPEVVGEAALRVDPLDREAVAEAMLRLATDHQLRADLEKRSLARAAEFSWDRCAQDVKNAYAAML